MSSAIAVAEQFARLVEGILLDRPEALRERTLGALLHAVIQSEPTTLEPRLLDLIANGEVVTTRGAGIAELAAQIRGHEVKSLTIGPDASPAELLAVAEQLAREPERGAAARGFARSLIGVGRSAIEATYDSDPRLADIMRVTPTSLPGIDSTIRKERGADSLSALLAELEATQSPNEIARILDLLVPYAERAADKREGRPIAELLDRVFRARAATKSEGALRMYTIGVRRLARGLILQHVVPLIGQGGDDAALAVAVLRQTGELGAQLLVDRLPIADTRAERRALFNILVQLKPAPDLIRWLLTDPRWFVVRNGLDLAAELKASDLEDACVPLVKHEDERVRRSAVQAVGRFATPRSVRAVEGALVDPAPQVRAKAAVTLGASRHPRATERLLTAISAEQDPEVLTALHVALAAMGTPEALAQLIEGAKPGGLLFKRKSTALRVAAVQGLSHASSPDARKALDALSDDKDPDVRAALQRAKRPSRAIEAMSDPFLPPETQ